MFRAYKRRQRYSHCSCQKISFLNFPWNYSLVTSSVVYRWPNFNNSNANVNVYGTFYSKGLFYQKQKFLTFQRLATSRRHNYAMITDRRKNTTK